MLIGFVASEDKGLLESLEKEGCRHVVQAKPPHHHEILEAIVHRLEGGDAILVPSLSDLRCTPEHFRTIIGQLSKRGAYLRTLQEGLDTRSQAGIAEAFERLSALRA